METSNTKRSFADFNKCLTQSVAYAFSKRPEIQKALALCRQKGATLVVAKIDRLSRDTEQALQIYRELDARLESCDIPNLDKFTLTLFMAIADRERELIGLRTKQALNQKRKQIGIPGDEPGGIHRGKFHSKRVAMVRAVTACKRLTSLFRLTLRSVA